MDDHELEIHPRLAQAHLALHQSAPYRAAIRLVDSGHVGSAIPHTHRSSVKGFIEQTLTHFHDLGFQKAYEASSMEQDTGWKDVELSEGRAFRQRMEGLLSRMADDFRRQHRDVETKWKKATNESAKQKLFQDMNELRRNSTKIQSLDKLTLVNKVNQMCEESFRLGWDQGLGVRSANERKRRLGLPVDHIQVEVKLFIDPSLQGEDLSQEHLSL